MNCFLYMKDKFEKIILKFDLKIVKLSDEDIVLIGNGYVLFFNIHFDILSVRYIFRDEQDEFIYYNVDSYLASKYDDEDRAGIKEPKSVEETITATIDIWSRGLINHWKDLLLGKREWINDYQKFDLSGPARSLSINEADKIEKYI